MFGFVVGQGCRANQHRHCAYTISVLSSEGELMRGGTASPKDMDSVESDIIQYRRQVVCWLTKSPTRQSTRSAKAGALGGDDPKVSLHPGRAISAHRISAAWRSRNPQKRQTVLIPVLRPSNDASVRTLQMSVTNTGENRFAHSREVLQKCGPTDTLLIDCLLGTAAHGSESVQCRVFQKPCEPSPTLRVEGLLGLQPSTGPSPGRA